MWVREALEDLTAAEFACSLAAPGTSEEDKNSKKKSKSAVDFENILTKLEKRIEDMCVLSTYGDQDANCLVTFPLEDTRFDFNWSNQQCWTLKKNFGMGSVTYTDDQRNALAM